MYRKEKKITYMKILVWLTLECFKIIKEHFCISLYPFFNQDYFLHSLIYNMQSPPYICVDIYIYTYITNTKLAYGTKIIKMHVEALNNLKRCN